MSDHPELSLWRAVIALAIQDSTDWRSADVEDPKISRKTRTTRIDRAREKLRIRDSSRAWLLGYSADFREVCHLAQLDPDAVRDKARALAAADWPESIPRLKAA